jgi:hypothetical protein
MPQWYGNLSHGRMKIPATALRTAETRAGFLPENPCEIYSAGVMLGS